MSAATDRFVAAVLHDPDIPRELISSIEAVEYMAARELHVAVYWRCRVEDGDEKLAERVELVIAKRAPAWAVVDVIHLGTK